MLSIAWLSFTSGCHLHLVVIYIYFHREVNSILVVQHLYVLAIGTAFVIWQRSAHTTDQLTSPNCKTEAIWLPIQAHIEYKLSTLCHSSVTPFSLIQPLFICLTFSVSALHQDSSAPHLTQELFAFRK